MTNMSFKYMTITLLEYEKQRKISYLFYNNDKKPQ